MAITRLYTVADLLELPDDGWRHELIEGDLIQMPPPGGAHGSVEVTLIEYLGPFVRANRLGKVFGGGSGFPFEVNPDTLLGPDIAFVDADRLPPRETWNPYPPVVPDLVVEIISPSERSGMVERKVAKYLATGVRMIWLIRSTREVVEVRAPDAAPVLLASGDTLTGGDVLPGFAIPVADLFT